MHDAKLQRVNLKAEIWMNTLAAAFCLLLDSAGARLLFTVLNLEKQKYPRIREWQDDVR